MLWEGILKATPCVGRNTLSEDITRSNVYG